MKKDKPIYTLDSETDPFVHGRKPLPFAWGLFTGTYFDFTWGDNCTEEMLAKLYELPPGIIYMHNGGRFDIYFMIEKILNKPMKIINGRITKALIDCLNGQHEIRDSYAIMPQALGSVDSEEGKLDIDYKLMERETRDEYKDEILTYLKRDVMFLWRLCVEFVDMFGVQLTIGGTAMKELRKIHKFEKLTLSEDQRIRPFYFYGGRVECFESGIIEGDFTLYDLNSAYPHAMKSSLHPVGKCYFVDNKISKDTFFVTARGTNRGAFPMRTKLGLTFSEPYGVFHVTIHEWKMAKKLRLFDCDEIIECHNFAEKETFAEFIDKYYNLRMGAEENKDKIKKLFYKLVMNSAYGKFTQSSDNYCEYRLTDQTKDMRGEGWELHSLVGSSKRACENWIIWQRASLDESMYNVATGCSITGAVRATLMQAIHSAKRPIYCDTDSLICESMKASTGKQLGQWKVEAKCDRIAMAGKKLYALFENGRVVKQANKGVKISANEIVEVCKGNEIECFRDAPSFKLDGSYTFIDRTVRMTV